MMLRFWHWLSGHRWVEHSTVAFKGTNKIGWRGELSCDDHRMETYGFTDVDFFCSCGEHKRHRLVGYRDATKDTEVAQLRKMANL